MHEERPLIYDLSRPQLAEQMAAWGEPAYRAKQVYRQLYVNLADGPGAMSDLLGCARSQLERGATGTHPTPARDA